MLSLPQKRKNKRLTKKNNYANNTLGFDVKMTTYTEW